LDQAMSQELFDRAVQLEEAGKLEEALVQWRELAASNPTRNVMLRLGGCAKKLGRIEEAEQAFTRASEIDPRSALALTHLGILAKNRGDYESAKGYLERALAIEESPCILSLLGVTLRHFHNDIGAEGAYRRAIQLDPKYEEAYFNLGVLLRKSRPSEAHSLFRRSLELDPDYGAAHRELGWWLHRNGSSPEADFHLRRAVELSPDDQWAHIYLGTYLWGNDVDRAINEFEIARKLNPEWSVPLWSLGNIVESILEDFDTAQSFFEMAVEADGEDVVALTHLGRLCKKRGQIDLARTYLSRAAALDPQWRRAHTLLNEIDNQL
jgi:tetratricopeptide (TPR) repeat protein